MEFSDIHSIPCKNSFVYSSKVSFSLSIKLFFFFSDFSWVSALPFPDRF
ncbi:hypothetical protein EVA_05142 [gut metagenome]|uniref:Uncharacterized protein n=1 Tax=gut metagenome TaxID=749906 RepID=J9GH26_9ZZZZ